jgi:hypothetical protein
MVFMAFKSYFWDDVPAGAFFFGFMAVCLLGIASLVNWQNGLRDEREHRAALQLEADYPEIEVVKVSFTEPDTFVWEVGSKLCRASLRKYGGHYVLPEYPSCSMLPK